MYSIFAMDMFPLSGSISLNTTFDPQYKAEFAVETKVLAEVNN